MTFPHDFTGVKEKSFEILPDGIYNLRIVSAEEGVTKNGDNKVTVGYEVADGDHVGRSVKMHNVVFFPPASKNGWVPKAFLSAIGESSDGSVDVDPLHWIGKIVVARIGRKEYEGRIYNDVKWVKKYEIDYTLPAVAESAPAAAKVSDDVPF